MRKNCAKGFTLMEILIAMAILVVVIASTVAIFRISATSWRRGEMRALRYQQARFILERMGREIASIVPSSLAGPYCLGSADRFYFISALADAPASIIEVGYWLNAQTQELMRGYQSTPDYDFGTWEKEEPLSENVSSLRFGYSTGEAWQKNWDSRPGAEEAGVLPRAVRIEFTLQDEKSKRAETFSTVVTIAVAEE